MKLLTLQISNFISIRKATINFDELNDGVFLISGPTGSGKSSMLDAIHWVLFGKTLSSNRAAVAKEIRSSYAPKTEDTVVSLTFNQDKVDYKVVRTLKKDGGTSVQLYCPGIIYDKVKEANEQLEKIIGLTVKQFDQMVMLEQGNFSKFLLADSRTRAEILRDIFDTQLFKEIELRFKDRCDKLKSTILASVEVEQGILQGKPLETVESEITNTVQIIQIEQSRLTELKSSLQEAQDMLPALLEYDSDVAVYKKAQAELAELQQLESEIQSLYAKKKIYETYMPILQWYHGHQRLTDELASAEKTAADYAQKIKDTVVDDTLAERVESLQTRKNTLTQIADVFNNIGSIQSKIEQLNQELSVAQQTVSELNSTIEKGEADKQSLTDRLAARQEYETAKKQVLYRMTERARIQQYIADLTAYIEKEKGLYAQFLTNKLMGISEPGICPICNQPYTPGHTDTNTAEDMAEFESNQEMLEIQKLKLVDLPELEEPECSEAVTASQLTQQLSECSLRVANDTAVRSRIKDQVVRIEGQISAMSSELTRLQTSVSEYDATSIQSELETITEEYSQLWSKVDENELAKRSRNLLQGYLGSVEAKIKTLKKQISDSLALPEARVAGSPDLETAIASEDTINDYRVHINDYLYKIQHYEMLKDNLMSVVEPENPYPGHTADSCKQSISDMNISIEESIRQISSYQGSLESRKETVKRVRDLRSVRDNDTKSYDTHQYLYNLMSGKNNSKISFETFVLHRQLEWILQSSNQYLHTLSAGQFELQVKWESSSGRTQGGLEITITDHFTGSTRPAQTYSGGELFMLSLSLSLGLMTSIDSLFTARDLNLLFVDEGFGTLDSECLSRTLTTLHELKNIRSVGIISHVQDLIDTIPQGYIVEKTASGSRIRMFKNN